MKKIAIILGGLVLFAACGNPIYSAKSESCTTSATGDTITLAYQQPVNIFAKCADNTSASITSIKDSRCPKGVQCVWAGTAAVTLQLGGNFNVALEIGKQIDTTYNQKKYSFLLVDVNPYPTAGTATVTAGSVALLRIIKSERPTELGTP